MRHYIILLFLLFSGFTIQAQDSLEMSLVSTWKVDSLPMIGNFQYNDIWGYTDCEGNEYAIIGSTAYVHFINITDPNNIYEVNHFAGGDTSLWRDFKTYKHYAYAVADQNGSTEGLMVFDLSYLPDSVVLVNQTNDDFNKAHNIFIEEATSRLYVVGTNPQANYEGMLIYDLSNDPVNPELLSSVNLSQIGGPFNSYIHDVYVRDNIAYCSHVYAEQLYIYDVSDPVNIEVMGSLLSYLEQGLNHSSWLNEDGTQLVFADETKGSDMKILDLTDMDDLAITPQDLFKSQLEAEEKSIAHNPFIRDQYVFIAYYHDGVQIFDISDPDNVTNVAYYDTYENTNYNGFRGAWGVYPFLPSEKIIASDINSGLYVLTLDNIDLDPIVPTLYPANDLTQTSLSFCAGDSVVLYAAPGAESYAWSQEDAILSNQTADSLVVKAGGNYSYTASNDYCRTNSLEINIEEYLVSTPSISVNLPMLSTDNAASYQWYLNGNPIPNATNASHEAVANGDYAVEIIDANGCKSISETQYIAVVGLGEIESVKQLAIFPNPAEDVVNIQLVAKYDTDLVIAVKNVAGQELNQQKIQLNGSTNHKLSFAAYPAGVYFIHITDEKTQYVQRIIKH